MIVLDTNVLSELFRPLPEPRVVAWLLKQPGPELYTTTVTQAEILFGIDLLPKGKRRSAMEAAAQAIFEREFQSKILPFDVDAARLYPKIAVSRRIAGRPITEFDTQIAAITRSWNATLATRNTSDFEDCGIQLFDPWTNKSGHQR